MLSYPATIPLSSRTLNHLAERIRGHRKRRRSRWRRLDPSRQALLALAHLRNGDTYARLAADFEIGVTTAWRYVKSDSPARDDLDTAIRRIRLLAYAVLDGTLSPTDRIADQKPYYSGKHQHHGVSVQVIADAAGRLVGASSALPCLTFADKGYQGARGSVRTPFQAAPLPPEAVTQAEGREPHPRKNPRPRRTRDRHPQDLEDLGQAALLPTASERDRAGNPRPATRRSQPLRRMKMAHFQSPILTLENKHWLPRNNPDGTCHPVGCRPALLGSGPPADPATTRRP